MEWLGWSEEQSHYNNQIYKVYTPKALHPSLSVCKGCYLFARHMFQIELPTNEKGCFGQPFPDAIEALPDLAQQYINTHLTLPLLEKLIVPMMDYVSGTQAAKKEAALQTQLDQRNTQLQARDTALQQQQVQITALKEENNALRTQVNTKEQALIKTTTALQKEEQKNARLATKLHQQGRTLQQKQTQINTLQTQLKRKQGDLKKIHRKKHAKAPPRKHKTVTDHSLVATTKARPKTCTLLGSLIVVAVGIFYNNIICPKNQQLGLLNRQLQQQNTIISLCRGGNKDFQNQDLTHLDLQGIYLQGMNFTHAKLPQNLSGGYLSYVDLTGQHFTCTDFTNTQFDGVLLTNTTCDYQQCFQDNVKATELGDRPWYLDNLPTDLQSITRVYPKILQDHHKAELLQIASGIAYLPYYKDKEFDIKVGYWSTKLLLLKKQLGTLGNQLVCSMAAALEYEVEKLCWQTDYPQNQVEEVVEAPHTDFDKYLKTFQDGLVTYNCKSKNKRAYNWYKKNIKKSIQGLKKTYPKLTSQALRKEAIDIAFQLSETYKTQHQHLLHSYLDCQNRLIHLKISAGAENNIHYSPAY